MFLVQILTESPVLVLLKYITNTSLQLEIKGTYTEVGCACLAVKTIH